MSRVGNATLFSEFEDRKKLETAWVLPSKEMMAIQKELRLVQ